MYNKTDPSQQEMETKRVDVSHLLDISVAKLAPNLQRYPCWCTNIFDPSSAGCCFYSVTRTPEEVSVIINSSAFNEYLDFRDGPVDVESEWVTFKVKGQLDFALVGIIAKISTLLSESEISLFVSSTFLTDYVLVKKNKAMNVQKILTESGCYEFTNPLTTF